MESLEETKGEDLTKSQVESFGSVCNMSKSLVEITNNEPMSLMSDISIMSPNGESGPERLETALSGERSGS